VNDLAVALENLIAGFGIWRIILKGATIWEPVADEWDGATSVTDARTPNEKLRKSVMTLAGLTLLFALGIVGLVLVKDANGFFPSHVFSAWAMFTQRRIWLARKKSFMTGKGLRVLSAPPSAADLQVDFLSPHCSSSPIRWQRARRIKLCLPLERRPEIRDRISFLNERRSG
jgi:hypothetical protein